MFPCRGFLGIPVLVSRLDKLEEQVFHHVFELNPRQAVMLGLHDYDGFLPDLSADRLKEWAEKAAGLLKRIKDEFMNSTRKDGKTRNLWKLCSREPCSRYKISVRILLGRPS